MRSPRIHFGQFDFNACIVVANAFGQIRAVVGGDESADRLSNNPSW
jgi:hypothetical protein